MGGGSEVPPHHVPDMHGEVKMIEDIHSKNEIAVLVTGFGVCFSIYKLLLVSSTTRLCVICSLCRVGVEQKLAE